MEAFSINSVLKTEQEYHKALKEVEILMNKVEPNTPEGNRYELLCLLVEDYEEKHFPIDDPDPIEMIKFRLDQLNLRSLFLLLRHSSFLSRKRISTNCWKLQWPSQGLRCRPYFLHVYRW